MDRKGGKFSDKWLGPYVLENKGLCTLRNQSGIELSKKYNAAILKLYLDPPVNPADDENKDVPLDEKPPNLQDDDPHKPDF